MWHRIDTPWIYTPGLLNWGIPFEYQIITILGYVITSFIQPGFINPGLTLSMIPFCRKIPRPQPFRSLPSPPPVRLWSPPQRHTHRDTRTGRGPSMSQTSSVRLWTVCQGRFLTWRENHWVDNVCERSWEDHPIILMFDHHFLITAISWWQITLFWWTNTQQSVESSVEAQRVAATTKRSSSSQKMSWVRPALVLWLEVDRGSSVFATFWTDSCTSVCGGKRANGGNCSADCWTLIVRPWQFESVISWGEYRLLHLSEVKNSSEISRKFEGVRSQGLVGNVNSGRLSLSGGMAGVDKFLWLDARHRDSFPAFNGWKKAPEFLGKVPADADGSWWILGELWVSWQFLKDWKHFSDPRWPSPTPSATKA